MGAASGGLHRTLCVYKFFVRAADQYDFRSCARIGQGERTPNTIARARNDGQAAIEAEGR